MAGTSVPMPDQDSQAFLDNARSAAAQSLKGKMPDSMLEPLSTAPRTEIHISGPGPHAEAPQAPPQDPGPAAAPLTAPDEGQAPPPPPTPAATPPDDNTYTHALVESAGELGGEVGKGLMRGAVGVAKALGFATVGASHLIPMGENAHNAVDDTVFNFIKSHVDSAYDYWKGNQDANGAAQIAGNVAEGVAPMMLGPAGVPAIAATQATEAGADSIDRGESTKVAATLAVIRGAAGAAGAAIPSKDPRMIARIAKWVGAGEALNQVSDRAAQWVMNQAGYKEAAAKIDPNNPDQAAVTALMQVVFALLHSPAGAKVMDKAQPKPAPPPSDSAETPDLSANPPPGPAGTDGQEPPPPAMPPKTAGEIVGNTRSPDLMTDKTKLGNVSPLADTSVKSVSAVPDVPSAEPTKDLMAQKADAQDPNTPRQGVYLSKDARKAVSPADMAALKEGMVQIPNFDKKGGLALVPDADTAKAMRAYRASEPDMQAVLGRLTGAGDGKDLSQTAVVQGQTPDGAVAKESAVAPAEVPAAVQAVTDEGKIPVVTTPDEVQARRAQGVAEQQAPAPEMTSTPTAGGNEPEPVPAPKFATGQRKLVKIGGEDVPVVVAGEVVDGKVPVRTVDDEGRVSKDVRQVPEHMFGQEAEAAPAETPAAPAEPKAGTAEPTEGAPKIAGDLKAAVDLFNQQNTPEPGKRFAGSVKEHAQRVGELARAVKAAAAADGVPDAVRAHALEAAKRVERIDTKTDESMTHNRGVGHSMLDSHAENLLRAADNIMDPEHAKIPEKVVAPKAEALKAKILKAREKANAAATPEPDTAGRPSKAPRVRAKTKGAAEEGDVRPTAEAARGEDQKVRSAIPDVEDVTKPKKLSNAETRDAQGAIKRYLNAADHEAPEAHDAMETKLSEIYGPNRAHEVQNIIQMAREQRDEMREDPYTPKRMSETVDDEEFKGHHVDDESLHGNEDYEDAGRSRGTVGRDSWNQLHNQLGPLWNSFFKASKEGKALSGHKILDYMAARAPEGAVKDLITHVRNNVPDINVRPVEQVKGSRGNDLGAARGVYSHKTNDIQIRARPGEINGANTRTILHEMIHAATAKFVETHPDHPLSKEINRLHELARDRISRILDEAHAMNRPLDGAPAGWSVVEPEFSRPQWAGDYYGLKDVHEFMAEGKVNPDFQHVLANSEKAASLFENLRNVVSSIGRKVAELLGIKDPRTAKLLNNTLDVTDRIMEAARYERENGSLPPEHTVNDLEHMDEAPPPLPHDDEYRSVVGDHATQVARMFRRAVRSGAVETVRRNVRAFTTYSQLVRVALRRGVFGSNDHTNPLREYDENIQQRDSVINRQAHGITGIVNDRAKLSFTDDKKLGQFQIDSTMYGIDPEGDKTLLPTKVTSDPKFKQRWQDFQDRWNALTDQQRDIYRRERDMNATLFRANRRAAIDAALQSYSDTDVPAAVRRLLYSVDNPADFKGLIGKNGLVDVGERNDKLVESLQDLASTYGMEGPYFHLGRHGDHVVQANPEGTKTFASEGAARSFAARVESLSPRSKATVDHIGGQWQVDYKADYVSMHSSPAEAEAEIERLRASGIDVGSATTKILSERNAALSGGVQNIIAEANRRLERRGTDTATKELQETLRQSFVQLMAARSAYAASKLARKNVGGVKGEEMGRNFATHAQSMAWNTGHLATVFKIGEALGKLREAVKDGSQPQGIAHQRGRVYDELSRRLAQENQQFGQHTPFNSLVAKAGFLNYMTSFSHSLVYLTQNFSTAIPAAMVRHGSFRALDSFRASMNLVSSPAFRETFRALAFRGDAESILKGVYAAVAKDKRFGKWAQGDNSPLQQLIDRGAIHTSLSNQLAEAAKGGGKITNRVFEYARILPSVADLFNRVSTGLAALELHKGDVYRAGDFVKETHMDYSQGEKPRAFRAVSRLWGGNSVTMFRTYTQGMAHILYSHIFDVAHETEGGRAGALKTVAGLMLGATAFAGVQRGFGLEPIRALMWAYHKIAGDNDEYYNFDNQSRRFVAQVAGENKISDVINGGLPRAFGFDISSRMGLSDLFYHDPPDISTLDSSGWGKIASGILGPGYQEVADQTHALSNAFATGRMSDFAKAIPIKIVQNAVNAYTSGTEGATNARGIHLTDPSAGGAVANAIGVKTAEQAKVQEKQNTDSDYRQWAEQRKYAIIQRFAQADPSDRQTYVQQAQNFSNNNPGHRITYADLLKAARSMQRQQSQVDTGRGRDPVQNSLNEY